MFKYFTIVFSLIVLQIQVIYPQVLSRPSLINVINRPGQETILEGPRNFPQPYNPQIIENFPPSPFISPVSPAYSPVTSPVTAIAPAATTIVTDCSPSVCKNLANTLQLMIVCNLLQNTQGGSDLAVQLAAPIISEAISSPSFPCGCPNPLFPNPISPKLPTAPPSLPPSPPITSPNKYPSMITSNIIPNYANSPVVSTNGFLYNLI